jgi:hypothetical protein
MENPFSREYDFEFRCFPDGLLLSDADTIPGSELDSIQQEEIDHVRRWFFRPVEKPDRGLRR